MKILYLCHRIPYPPQKGDKIRSFHQIRHLAKNHEVHLFCLADQQQDLAYREHLQAFCASVEVVYLRPMLARIRALTALLLGRPLSLGYFHAPILFHNVRRAAKSIPFDVAVAYSSGMVPYLLDLPIPLAIDFVDLDSQKWLQYAAKARPPLRWLYGLEGRRLFAFEKMSSKRADVSIVVTREEGRILLEEGAPRRLEAVPLGVDLDYYRLDIPPAKELAGCKGPVLIFVGVMSYRPNYEAAERFCRSILPRIRSEIPDVLFLVVGSDPPPRVRALQDGRGVIVTGRVPDTRPYLRAADLSVAPLSMARGIQTKVLEAMAMGLPVVLAETASRGVGAVPGRDYLVAGDDATMAEGILSLLKDSDRARAMGAAGRNYVKKHFAWPDKLVQYEKILEEIVQTPAVNKVKVVHRAGPPPEPGRQEG